METSARPRRFRSAAVRWAALARRDAAADGHFYYGVVTTGVFCRPSCGARMPRRENVRFFDTVAAAEQAGLRACKRCRPDAIGIAERHATLIARACHLIEQAERAPDLAELAHGARLSPFHFHRLFKQMTGLTPGAYRRAHRATRLRESLLQTPRVTDALYEAGFGSSGRLHAASAAALGMSPRRYQRGGGQVRVRFAIGACSLGALLVAATDRGVCAILLGEEPQALLDDLQHRLPRAEFVGADAQFERTVATVAALVESPARSCALPLDVRGTAFQHRVWDALRAIEPGTTASYSEIARRLGRPSAVRAVARAVASNPLAVLVPCHRVVRLDGALGGYRWGVARKRELLAREAGDT